MGLEVVVRFSPPPNPKKSISAFFPSTFQTYIPIPSRLLLIFSSSVSTFLPAPRFYLFASSVDSEFELCYDPPPPPPPPFQHFFSRNVLYSSDFETCGSLSRAGVFGRRRGRGNEEGLRRVSPRARALPTSLVSLKLVLIALLSIALSS